MDDLPSRCLFHPSRKATRVICVKCGDWMVPGTPDFVADLSTNAGVLQVAVVQCGTCDVPIAIGIDAPKAVTLDTPEGLKVLNITQVKPHDQAGIALCEQCSYTYGELWQLEKEEWQQALESSKVQGITLERTLRLHIAHNCDWETCNFFPRCQAPLDRSEDYERTNDLVGCRQCGKLHDWNVVVDSTDAFERGDFHVYQCDCGQMLFLGSKEDIEVPWPAMQNEIARLGGIERALEMAENRAFICRDCVKLYGENWRSELDAFRLTLPAEGKLAAR